MATLSMSHHHYDRGSSLSLKLTVVDYRTISRLTMVDKYPLPRIDEKLDLIGNASYFYKLYLYSGLHQILVHPDRVDQTAFRTKYGTFAHLVMSLGLCNAPATCQKTMDYVFQSIRQFAGPYTDVILVYTNVGRLRVLAASGVCQVPRGATPDKSGVYAVGVAIHRLNKFKTMVGSILTSSSFPNSGIIAEPLN